MHYTSVMITGEEISGSSHVGCELIDIVNSFDSLCGDGIIPQIANQEVIGRGVGKFRVFEIYAANPKPFVSQSGDQMASNEPASTIYKNSLHWV